MRSFFRWFLAFFTLGVGVVACNKVETNTGPRDVTLHVPGMF
jgi:hypothetical protein